MTEISHTFKQILNLETITNKLLFSENASRDKCFSITPLSVCSYANQSGSTSFNQPEML